MPITALVGGVMAAGSIGGAAIQANAAGNAASAQQTAAQQVSQMAQNAATKAASTVSGATNTANTGLFGATQEGNEVIGNSLARQLALLSPYLKGGATSLGELQQIFSPTGTLAAPQNQFKFTSADYANSPEFAFEQQQANLALQRSAAAQGTLMGGGTVRASDRLNTGLASTYLDQAFNRALSTYNTNRQNLLTRIQGLTNITGLGFNATGAGTQDIGAAGQLTNANIQNSAFQRAANTINSGMYQGNTGLQAAQISEGAITGAANAQSAADIAQGKAWGGALTGLTNIGTSLFGLSQLPTGWGNFGGGSGGGFTLPASQPATAPGVNFASPNESGDGLWA